RRAGMCLRLLRVVWPREPDPLTDPDHEMRMAEGQREAARRIGIRLRALPPLSGQQRRRFIGDDKFHPTPAKVTWLRHLLEDGPRFLNAEFRQHVAHRVSVE